MKPPGVRPLLKRVFRIATLVVPSAIAWCEAFADPRSTDLSDAVKFALGPLWLLLAAALVLRAIGAASNKKRDPSVSVLAQLDVLTSAGSALAWFSAFAIMGAVWLGWASLAVVGLLGTGLFHVVVLFTFLVVRGVDPMRGATISRRFSAERVTEGDDLVEELRFSGVRIPIGFRLFAEGRVGPRWPTTRHVLDASEAGGDVVLQCEVGPALRGEHDAEPTAVWLEDTFGLCRSLRVAVAPARLTVFPRVRDAQRIDPPLDKGDGPRAPRAATRMPTEGFFRLREYQQGDDVRRIHWVRSLAARELIVRLPDELPPDQPHVRLVLDTFFPEAKTLACDAPADLLDSLVEVWLSVGRSLAESGSRVTLVSALPQGSAVIRTRIELKRRVLEPALRFGAQVTWQDRMLVDELLTDDATLVVSRAALARPHVGRTSWIAVVPAPVARDAKWPYSSGACMPYPMGTPDNRWSRRRRDAARVARARQDNALIVMHGVARSVPGSFLARDANDGTIRLETMR